MEDIKTLKAELAKTTAERDYERERCVSLEEIKNEGEAEISKLKAEVEDLKNYQDIYKDLSAQKSELLTKFQKDNALWKYHAAKYREALEKIKKLDEPETLDRYERALGWDERMLAVQIAQEALKEAE